MSEVRDDIPTTSHCSQPTEPTTSHATHANFEFTDSHCDEQYEESSIFDSHESDRVIKVLNSI